VSLHTFTQWTEQDTPFLVRFEVTPAQRQTETDPGHAEALEVTEVNFGGGWEPVSDHQDLDMARLTLAAGWHWERVREEKEADQAERVKECEA
jgi:hypothetical protein